MIIKIGDNSYAFKTSFAEYTWREFVPILKARSLPVVERLSVYTNIPIDVLNSLTIAYLSSLLEAVKFNEDDDLLLLLCDEYKSGQQIHFHSYGRYEQVRQIVKGKEVLDVLHDVVNVYNGMKIEDMPLIKVFSIAMFYLSSLNEFNARYSRLSDHKYSDEEIEAGVEDLEGFGFFGTVLKIARERGLKNDEVLNMKAIEVMDEVLYDFERSEYEKRLNKLVNERNEHFNKINHA